MKTLVLTISGLALCFGVYLITTAPKTEAVELELFDECVATGGYMETCGFYLDEIASMRKATPMSFAIGIGLPILFFGGTALINYLAPEEKNEIF